MALALVNPPLVDKLNAFNQCLCLIVRHHVCDCDARYQGVELVIRSDEQRLPSIQNDPVRMNVGFKLGEVLERIVVAFEFDGAGWTWFNFVSRPSISDDACKSSRAEGDKSIMERSRIAVELVGLQ